MSFIGRDYELEELENLYQATQGKCVVVYGRRRVGKSSLIEKFIGNKLSISLEGLEKVQTKGQIKQATKDLIQQINEPLLRNVKFDDWSSFFDYLTEFFKKSEEKYVLFLDEFQWLAANQTKLVSLIKSYWDRHWSKQKVMLILCGSVSSYMIKRVIKSKALYGRINWELCLQPFEPNETYELLENKRSQDEVLLYSLILGGIPKYLQEISPNRSFDQNINKLFFVKNALLANEYERIFFSQFKEHKTYELIVMALKEKPCTLEEISQIIKMPSGGGLKVYLENLEQAAFITSFVPYNSKMDTKLIKYKLTDEYLRFYFKYVAPNIKLINHNQKQNLFSQLVKPVWLPWLGFAFENYCFKNAFYLAHIMGFSEQVLHWGPLFHQGEQKFQIDLIYVRQDKVITVCEIKYHSAPIGVEIVHEMERKCDLISLPRGYTLEKALISRFGMDKSLSLLKYFHHSIMIEDFFKKTQYRR